MKPLAILGLGPKVVLLTFIHFALYIVVYAVIVGPTTAASSPATLAPAQTAAAEDAVAGLLPMLAVSFLNTLVLTVLILRSRWYGWRLAATVAFIYYTVQTFMSQIETAILAPVAGRMPEGMLASLFVAGLVLAVLFAPVAVLVLGKWRKAAEADERNERLLMNAGEWAWKLAAIVLLYEAVYFTFGYFVVWKNPEALAYYGSTDPGNLFAQIGNVLRDTPWLALTQAVRALLWVVISLPMIRMLKGAAWETGLVVGLVLSVLLASQLLLPNALMPDSVRVSHLIEIASSNFVFGVLLSELLLWRPKGALRIHPAPA